MSLILKHKGVQLTIGGEEFVFAPLPVATLMTALPMLKEKEAATVSGDLVAFADYANVVTEMAFVSLRRNYPDITQERVAGELVDAGNLADVVTAMLDVSGAVRKAQAEGKWMPGN